MLTLIVAFSISLVTTTLVIRFDYLHRRFSGDHDRSGVQKFHTTVVSRIGGVGVALALVGAAVMLFFTRPDVGEPFLLLLVASLPAFFGGAAEDLTKRVGVKARLALTVAAALIGFWLLRATLTRVGIPLVDDLLRYWIVALVVTAVAVGGVANAINIIDGFNGLASMVSVMIFCALGYVSFILGDHLLWHVCIASVGAVLGFFLWNYPRGLIFLGDGGAYLIGFLIGEISVLLVARHQEVSPWFPMLLVIYPVFETIFSVYRRIILQGVSPGMPDALHLHTLVFKRLVRWAAPGKSKLNLSRNSATSPYLWFLCSIAIAPAILFWRHTPLLIFFVLFFIVTYVWIYRRIVRFRRPRLTKKSVR